MSADTDRFGERLANVEGTVEQMDKRIADLRSRMDERFNTVDSRFDSVDRRFESLDNRFDTVDDRFDMLDGQMNDLEAKIEQNRREMRRLLLVLFAGLSLVVAVVSVVVQVAL